MMLVSNGRPLHFGIIIGEWLVGEINEDDESTLGTLIIGNIPLPQCTMQGLCLTMTGKDGGAAGLLLRKSSE
jgi:hypothetical protein